MLVEVILLNQRSVPKIGLRQKTDPYILIETMFRCVCITRKIFMCTYIPSSHNFKTDSTWIGKPYSSLLSPLSVVLNSTSLLQSCQNKCNNWGNLLIRTCLRFMLSVVVKDWHNLRRLTMMCDDVTLLSFSLSIINYYLPISQTVLHINYNWTPVKNDPQNYSNH